MDEVIDLLQSLMQQAGELADELSEEEMAQVLTLFQEAIQLIQEQEAEIGIGNGSDLNLPSSEYPSSNVNGFYYDPDSQELKVQFHGPYPQAEGPVYSYAGVPEYIFKILERGGVGPKTSGQNRYHAWHKGVTPSLGAAVNALLKAGGFAYQKLS